MRASARPRIATRSLRNASLSGQACGAGASAVKNKRNSSAIVSAPIPRRMPAPRAPHCCTGALKCGGAAHRPRGREPATDLVQRAKSRPCIRLERRRLANRARHIVWSRGCSLGSSVESSQTSLASQTQPFARLERRVVTDLARSRKRSRLLGSSIESSKTSLASQNRSHLLGSGVESSQTSLVGRNRSRSLGSSI